MALFLDWNNIQILNILNILNFLMALLKQTIQIDFGFNLWLLFLNILKLQERIVGLTLKEDGAILRN